MADGTGERGYPREIRAPRRMTDVEALMWNVEKDPHLDPSFASVTILDRPVDMARMESRVQRMAAVIPRLHQRVAPTLGRLAPPEWQDDPDFDLGYHLRHLALPAPGSERQLFDLATRFLADPLDRTRPLWVFAVVEGLDGGRAALIQKMHHTVTDGEGGIRMSEQFIDLDRDSRELEPLAPAAAGEHLGTSLVEAAVETAGHTWRRTVGVGQRALVSAAEVAIHPTRWPSLGHDLGETTASTLRQISVTDHAHSPLWTRRTLRRRLEVLDVPLDAAHAAARELGGSLNDFFVSGAAGGAGAYHRAMGQPVGSLRIAMPVSTRSDRSAGGNAFVPTRVVVPVDIEDPFERFAAIHVLLERTKREKAIGLVDQVAGLANLLPTSVLARFTLDQASTIDFATSNVRAAPFDLYIAGARIEATYPLGPLSNTAFNLTMMSYRGLLNMGLHVDSGAVADPGLLRDCIAQAYADQIAAVSSTRRS